MMNLRRTLAVAVGTVVVLSTAAISWRSHVSAIGSVLDDGAATVRALAGSPDAAQPERFLHAIVLPGAHVRLIGASDGIVYDAQNGDVEQHPVPPPGQDPGQGPGEPGPGGPPPGGPPPKHAASPFARLVADFAHIPPRHVQTQLGDVMLLPAADDLARWFTIEVAFVTIALGAIAGTATISRRNELRAAEALAEQNISREAEYRRFLADAGHELKTPLTIVTGYIDVLDERSNKDDATEQKIIGGMRSETKRMRDLVEKTLLLARLEARASVAQFIDAGAVATAVASDVRARYPSRSIETRCEESANIIADRHDLEAALRNLVENAVRYAPDSPILVETSKRANRVQVCVSDRGPGIAAEERALVFDRFYRGRERTDAAGSGLGLSIVRGVAERWDGTARIDSANGETRFILDFPLAEETES